MNLHQMYLVRNACYMAGVKMTPRGLMLHSTGANNPNLWRYIQPDDGYLGPNPYNNHWNAYHGGGADIGPHQYVDNGSGYCATCGGRQICAHGMIGLIADGDIAAYQLLPWDTQGWHSGGGSKGQANKLGIASNHGDVGHWFPRFGKSMDDFRKDVKEAMTATYWNTVDEVPEWGRATIQKLVDKGALKGIDDKGSLALTFDLVRLYVVHDRLGLYDLEGR